jgi:HNH endonuclease
MPTHLVNLDALIKREDFESGEAVSGAGEPVFKLSELQRDALYFSVLRKPDFQRVTMDWSPEVIVEFIKSFLDGEVIPALILWRSNTTGKVFTIDGAHRLSAFIAWVNDDYGDGDISREFFGYNIQPAQIRFHKKTQALMGETIGSYRQLVFAALNPQGQDEKMVLRGRTISTRQVPVQKVEGDASVAESSFFKINQNPAIPSPIELALTRARRKPNAIAVRALIRAGTGHKYWGKFPNRTKEIEELAANVHDLLFGKILEIESQTPDLPRAGQPYSAEAFTMILDMVNIFNDVTPAMWQPGNGRQGRKSKLSVPPLEDDPDGTITLKFLSRIKNLGALITGNEYPGSLGFDQAVYYYAATGKFHSSAFIAALTLASELHDQKKLIEFTEVRRDFEEFLVRHKDFINMLAHGKGGRTRPLLSLVKMHKIVLECLWAGIRDDGDIIERLHLDPQLADLKAEQPAPQGAPARKRFSQSVQAAAILRDILASRPRCEECGARLPPSARSKDHKDRQEEGGTGELENLQFTHPFCNTGYKEAKRARALKPA